MSKQEFDEFILSFAHEMDLVNQEMSDILRKGIDALPKDGQPSIFTAAEMAKHMVYSHLQAIVNDRLPMVQAVIDTKLIINNLNP